jgi:hypothetical protein
MTMGCASIYLAGDPYRELDSSSELLKMEGPTGSPDPLCHQWAFEWDYTSASRVARRADSQQARIQQGRVSCLEDST